MVRTALAQLDVSYSYTFAYTPSVQPQIQPAIDANRAAVETMLRSVNEQLLRIPIDTNGGVDTGIINTSLTDFLPATDTALQAIFDIYCQTENGDCLIVELQKAKQNFFKDRSVYYDTFPIQEQALQGDWNFELTPVYTVGVLDFVFDDHKDDPTLLHTVELKNQHCEVFYDKLKFIYLELPKFKKSLDELESHFDKWLFLLKHLAKLDDRPQPLQEGIFNELFEVAEIANFSRIEQESYQNSLKYYRDLNNVVDTARQEGKEAGLQEGLDIGRQEGAAQEQMRLLDRQRSLVLRLLPRQVGELPRDVEAKVNQLDWERLEALNEVLLEFEVVDKLVTWLNQ